MKTFKGCKYVITATGEVVEAELNSLSILFAVGIDGAYYRSEFTKLIMDDKPWNGGNDEHVGMSMQIANDAIRKMISHQ